MNQSRILSAYYVITHLSTHKTKWWLCKALCRSRRPTVSESKEKNFSRGTAVRSDHRSHHRSQTGTIHRSQHMINSRSFQYGYRYIHAYIHMYIDMYRDYNFAPQDCIAWFATRRMRFPAGNASHRNAK